MELKSQPVSAISFAHETRHHKEYLGPGHAVLRRAAKFGLHWPDFDWLLAWCGL